MKTYLISLTVFLCATTILHAQQIHNPFKHSASRHAKSGYSKATTEFLPQRTLEFDWDDVVLDWEEVADTTYTMYSANGKAIKETNIHYHEFMDTTFTNFKTHVYNTSDQLAADYYIYWKVQEQQWDTSSKRLYEYDSHGNEATIANYNKTNGVWDLEYNYESTNVYDTNERLLETTVQAWDKNLNVYVNESWNFYTYDVSGKLDGALILDWNDDDMQFDTSARITNLTWYKWTSTPLVDGLIQGYNFEEWNGSVFELRGRTGMIYDSHENMTDEKNETRDNNSWTIEYWDKYILKYNNDGALIEKMWQSWNGDTLENNNKLVFDNFIQYTGITHLTKQTTALNLYPNPFEKTAMIDIPSFSNAKNTLLVVYDLLGRSVLTQPIDAQKTILEKGNLQQGIYTFHLMENNNVTHTGKFIIK